MLGKASVNVNDLLKSFYSRIPGLTYNIFSNLPNFTQLMQPQGKGRCFFTLRRHLQLPPTAVHTVHRACTFGTAALDWALKHYYKSIASFATDDYL